MRIERTKVINVDKYLSALPHRASFRVIAQLEEPIASKLARCGYDPAPEKGATVLPTVVGRVSRYNSEGRWNLLRHLPKERRYLYSRSWVRHQWAGRDQTEEVEEIVDYYRDCYPRQLVEPPSIELTYLEAFERKIICSPELMNVSAQAELNKHVINLLLEVFGSCEVVLAGLERLVPPTLKRANWVMLPPGEHPWEQIENHIKKVLGSRSPTLEKAILDRQETILAHQPTKIYKGNAGFSDYVAYIFDAQGLVVLESIRRGNALYVLGQNWENVSKLSKAEIIKNELHENRIIHSKGWKVRLAQVLNRPMAAE